MPITAILVTYQSAACIHDALACVAASPRIGRCIVVDNASTDATVSIIQRDWPKVELLRNARNEGFGRAMNRALAQVTEEYAWLMNPDVRFDPGALDPLLAALQAHPEAAMAAPLLGDAAGIALRPRYLRDPSLPHAAAIAGSALLRTPFVSGACALWRMGAMRDVGFFDPALFLFYEDDDLSYRVARAGQAMLLCPALAVQHHAGTSVADSAAVRRLKCMSSTWSALYLRRKYQGSLPAYLQAAIACLAAGLRLAATWDPSIVLINPYVLRWRRAGAAARRARRQQRATARCAEHSDKLQQQLRAQSQPIMDALAQQHAALHGEHAARYERAQEEAERDVAAAEPSAHETAWQARVAALDAQAQREAAEHEAHAQQAIALLEQQYRERMQEHERAFQRSMQAIDRQWTRKQAALDAFAQRLEAAKVNHETKNEQRAAWRAQWSGALRFMLHPARFAPS